MRVLRCLVILTSCLLLLLFPRESRADTLKTDATLVIVGIIAVTAAITVAIVVVVRHKPSITGCATAASGGLALTNEGDGKVYQLGGDLASLTEGRRVRLTGSKHEDGTRTFAVKHVTRNYGPCAAAPAAAQAP